MPSRLSASHDITSLDGAPLSTARHRGRGVGAPPVRATARARALGGVSVLVIDDDTDGRDLVVTILRMEGAIVDSADGALAGYAAFERFRPCIIVSDIAMPEEDGYSLMRRIRAAARSTGAEIFAIALTAFSRPEDRERALRAGFDLHIGKPVRPSDLVAAVSRLAQAARG